MSTDHRRGMMKRFVVDLNWGYGSRFSWTRLRWAGKSGFEVLGVGLKGLMVCVVGDGDGEKNGR